MHSFIVREGRKISFRLTDKDFMAPKKMSKTSEVLNEAPQLISHDKEQSKPFKLDNKILLSLIERMYINVNLKEPRNNYSRRKQALPCDF